MLIESIDGSLQLFSRINDFRKYSGEAPYYRIELAGLTEHTFLNEKLYQININKKIGEIKKTDLIIIPIICGDLPKTIKSNEGFGDWIREQYHKGAEIASLLLRMKMAFIQVAALTYT